MLGREGHPVQGIREQGTETGLRDQGKRRELIYTTASRVPD